MATATVYPSSYSVVNGTWNDPTYMYADDGSYVTVAPTYLSANFNINYFFSSANIPSGSTINSVTLRTQWKASSSAALLSSNIQIGYDGSLMGSLSTDVASNTSDRTQSNTNTGTWTAEMLNSGLAYGAVNAYRANMVFSGTCSFDYLCIIVDYTEGGTPQEYTKELTASRPVISGLIVRLTLKTETANTALAASFTKKTGKTASAGVPVLSSAAKAAKKILSGSVSSAALSVKKAVKTLSAAVAAASNTRKYTSKTESGTASITGTARRKTFKAFIAELISSGIAVKAVRIARSSAVKITCVIRIPFRAIRGVILSWVIRDKQFTTDIRAKTLSRQEREKDISAEIRAKELEIKERKTDTEVMK